MLNGHFQIYLTKKILLQKLPAKNTRQNKTFLIQYQKTKDGDIELERLIKMFEEIIDVRDSSGKRHSMTHIIVMSVCGILNKCIVF